MSSEAPASADEVSELLRTSQASSIRVRGGGSKFGWGNVSPAPELIIDISGLDRVVEHAAGDLVVTVEAGVPLAELQSQLAGANQWLALDPPESGATVGGIVATAASGPRRLRWGTPRDLLIGITVVLADGTIARSGGKVVKNVAGYDLGKLFTGSYGTLGVVTQCTFRLHPRPQALRAVCIATDRVAPTVSAIKASGAQPSAMEWDGEQLTVVIESSPAAADRQAATVAEVAGGEIRDRVPDGFGGRPWRPGGTDIGGRFTHRLGALGTALDAIGRVVPDAQIRAQAGAGVVEFAISADNGIGWLDELRREADLVDGQVTVLEAPEDVKQAIDVWGPARGIDTMRRIKERFDPDRRMAPGIFVGGI